MPCFTPFCCGGRFSRFFSNSAIVAWGKTTRRTLCQRKSSGFWTILWSSASSTAGSLSLLHPRPIPSTPCPPPVPVPAGTHAPIHRCILIFRPQRPSGRLRCVVLRAFYRPPRCRALINGARDRRRNDGVRYSSRFYPSSVACNLVFGFSEAAEGDASGRASLPLPAPPVSSASSAAAAIGSSPLSPFGSAVDRVGSGAAEESLLLVPAAKKNGSFVEPSLRSRLEVANLSAMPIIVQTNFQVQACARSRLLLFTILVLVVFFSCCGV